MAEAVNALAQGFFAAVAAVGVLTWIYNRFFAHLRESISKKVLSLAILPGGILGGCAHAFAVYTGIPHLLWPIWIGFAIAIYKVYGAVRRWRYNRDVDHRRIPMKTRAVNRKRFGAPVRLALDAVSPINEIGDLQLAKLSIAILGAPPLRLVYLSDFHVHPALKMRYYEEVAEHALALGPDVLLVGGDFVSRRWHGGRSEHVLRRLAKHPRLIAVRGNHDYWTKPDYFARMLEDWGATLLRNDVAVIEHADRKLAIAGIEDPYIPLTPRAEAELAEKLGDMPRIGLVHTPAAYGICARLGCSFALAGHTHGGQIRLPFFGTTIASVALPEHLTFGAGRIGAMRTFTSNGIGAFFPFRFLCPPQIVQIEIGGE